MPKAQKAPKSAPTAVAVAVPGHQPAKKRGGKRSAQPAPLKAATSSQPKPRRAIVKKGAKRPSKRAVSSDEDEDDDQDNGTLSEDFDFPDDGMDAVDFGDVGGDEPHGEFADFLDGLNFMDDEEEEEANMQEEEDDEVDNAHAFVSRRAAVGTQLTTGHSTPLRTPQAARSIIPDGARPDVVGRSGDWTPYVPRVNPKDPSKPLVTLQSPLTRGMLKRVQHGLRSAAVTKNAFPDPESLIDAISELVFLVTRQMEAPSRGLRFKGDPVYQEAFLRMAKRSITGLRSEVASAGRDQAGPGYQLGPGLGSPAQNKAYVTMLTTRGNHVYRELHAVEGIDGTYRVTKRSGPYRHSTIAMIILQEFFTCHEQMAVAEHTKDLFNPIPLPVIAFAATVMQCALRDWATGVRIKSSSDFSADEWTTAYKNHMRELERMRDAQPEKVDMWTRKLWKDCWSATDQSLTQAGAEDDSFITPDELDDFADVEADA